VANLVQYTRRESPDLWQRKMQLNRALSTVSATRLRLNGQIGVCGGRETFLGFASAALLSRVSFSDVLDETSRTGYQRRFCRDHSLSFKRYIQQPGATTIPLTFNLRQADRPTWSLERSSTRSTSVLTIDASGPPAMSQVDCQHRLGYLRESPIVFAFMTFIGLPVEEEIRIFRDINGNAKGLSSSLLDYTSARLAQEDLAVAHPSIALALRLQEDSESPWKNRLDLGGGRTSGTKRMASLRTMQKAIRRFQREANTEQNDLEEVGRQLIAFWNAVVRVYPSQWSQPRRHLITKGVGVYSLMSLAGSLVSEATRKRRNVDLDFFVEKLSDFADRINWANDGEMRGYGGVGGADQAFDLLKSVRAKALGDPHGK